MQARASNGCRKPTATVGRPGTTAHTFHTYWVPDLPFGKGQRWATSGIAGKLLGGSQLKGLLSAMSSFPPYSLQYDAINLNATGSGQVPDPVKPKVAILGGIGPGRPWFDTTAFAPVNIPARQPRRIGNAGRNNIRGSGFFNTDASLLCNFGVKERVNVQFRAEAINAFNQPNSALGSQGDGNTNVSDPAGFGIISYTIGSNGAGGFSNKGAGERQLRFGLRVSF